MPTTTAERGSARERLLAAADELFYEEGVHTVGIDRVIERAGVAKASLNTTFGSKEELVRAYRAGRHTERIERMTRGLARYDNPRDRLLGVYDVLGEAIAQPRFRGCAFVNARAESSPGGPSTGKVEEMSATSRGWTRTLFTDLAREASVAHPEPLAAQLHLLYDGASVAGQLDGDRSSAATARAAAAVLLDAALAT
jgi:AcrR family transcriptional regulator